MISIKKLSRIAIIFLSVSLSFLWIEFFLSTLNFSKSKTRKILRLRDLSPSANIIFNFPEENDDSSLTSKVNLRTDNEGYILPYGSNDNKAIKILFLGGSTVESLRLEEKSRFPYLVSKKLNQHYDKENISFKALNSGVSGNNTMHSNFIFLAKGIRNKPNFAIMMHNVNDITSLTKQKLYKSYWNDNPSNTILKELSYPEIVVMFLNSYLPYSTENIIKPLFRNFSRSKKRDDLNKEKSNPIQVDINKIKKDYENSLNTFIDITRNWKVEPILMTQPTRLSNKPDDTILSEVKRVNHDLFISEIPIGYFEFKKIYEEFNEIVRKVSENRNIKIIDLAKEVPSNKEYFYDLGHLNNKGSNFVSEIIIRELIKKDFIIKKVL